MAMHQNNSSSMVTNGKDTSRKIAQGIHPRDANSPSISKVGVGGSLPPVHNENSVHNWHMGTGGGLINGTYYMGGQAIPDHVVHNISQTHGEGYKNTLQNLTSNNGHRLIVRDRERAAQIWNSGSRGPSVSEKAKTRGSKIPTAERSDGDYLYYDTDLGQGPDALSQAIAQNRQDQRKPWDKAPSANVASFKGKLTSDQNFENVENLIPDREVLQGFKQYPDPSENLSQEDLQNEYKYVEKGEGGAEKRYRYRQDEMGWTHSMARKVVDLFHMLPGVDTLVALAKAGEVKRGWYKNYSEIVRKIFNLDGKTSLRDLKTSAIGGDKNAEGVFRFTGLLAATSPKVPVDENLNSALYIWNKFNSFENLKKNSDPQSKEVVSGAFNWARAALASISPDLTTGDKIYNEQLNGYALMYFSDKESAAAYVSRKSAYKDLKSAQKRNTTQESLAYLQQHGFSSHGELDASNRAHRPHLENLQNIKDRHSQIYKDGENEINRGLLSTPIFSERYNRILAEYVNEGYDREDAEQLAERDTFNRFASKIKIGEGAEQSEHSITGLSFGAWFSNASAALYRDINDVSEYEQHHLFYGDEDSGEGRKVESFRRNLLGFLDASTNDSWQSNIGNVPQKLMGDERYHAFSAKMRTVADKMGWKAAEVQETMWSFYRTLVNLIGSEDLTVEQSLKTMTVGELKETDDFVDLLKDAVGKGEKKSAKQLRHLIEQAQISPDVITQFEGSTQPPEGKYTNSKQKLWDVWTPEERANVTDAVRTAGIHATSGSVGPRREKVLEGFKNWLREEFNIDFAKLGTKAQKDRKAQFNALPEQVKSNHLRQALPADRRQYNRLKKIIRFLKSSKPIRYAQFTPVNGGMQSAPVSDRTNVPFGNAVAKASTGKNIAHAKLNDQIASKAGIQSTSATAIGDWPNGSEQSTVHTAQGASDPDKMRYLAAWHGLASQKKSVLVFHPAQGGPDSLYHINHPETDLGKLREQLNQFNLQYKTLVPGAKGTKVILFDPAKGSRNSIEQFATKNNLEVVENTGQGEILGHNGDWNSAGALPKSRQAYNNIIAQYEQNQNSSRTSNNTGGTSTGGEQGGAGEAKKQLQRPGRAIKFDKARRILEGFLRAHNTPNKELPPVGDLLANDLQNLKPEHLSKYQQLVPGAKWGDIENAVSSLQGDPSLYEDMTSEGNRREMYCKEHARSVLHSSGLQKLLDSLVVQKAIPEHAQHLVPDAKDGDYFALEAISAELQHSIPALKAFAKAAEREHNKSGKAWDKMRSGVQKMSKKHHSSTQFRATTHGLINRGVNYRPGQFAPQGDGAMRFGKGISKLNAIYGAMQKFRGA